MHTWFQLGGPAEYFADPSTPDELIALVRRCREEDLPLRVLGSGSNILVRDEGVRGLVLRLTDPDFCEIQVQGDSITAGGGAKLGRVVTTAVHHGLAGLESLIGIPGSLGGALHGNVGGHGADIGQWTAEVTVVTRTGKAVVLERDDLVFGHRQSSIEDPVILSAKLNLERDDPRELARNMQKQWIIRKASHPMGHQCAGCVFKNPRGASAGDLIERSGLKGTRIGGAVVSDRHANFIVAEPEATSADVLRLIELIQAQVRDRMGIELELELEVW
jgi:UDP-N-acetylmuramate dehydrogenase